ncbi:UDP-Glc:alpha-D-GlcNAc-diphosphoundecaprenol beta-1,3-glucosyltransferase WfgD [Arthrobacter saudimassiliensis]|uniref:UDP-Glc:alpha-D-GlcNAc-diphosphoundecaprenol beta-1,3-glucosyltransferase WfgD n=1 Tax=Arthrobacter saudimassiliensis TaxID=1461584 RepID=A0A078MJH9_9MICC|nr:UDP-Glc:alpha-D-GlcNAc-diphosphoundecaprenol beta-1,3-glucosyltransferase WfgD [Arthrobacter saudimassiliensis]
MAAPTDQLETVTVVIATVDRPEMLRQAVNAALRQDYPGVVEVLVVSDGARVDPLADIVIPPSRSLSTCPNTRTPGLAGARNTGILAARGQYVAFCDDDDAWAADKLRHQIAAWQADPTAIAVATGVRISAGHRQTDRVPPPVTHFHDFLRSRVSAIHPSSLVYRTSDLVGRVGLVDEGLPFSYAEDYDLLLRATRFGHVCSVQLPLVHIAWGDHSKFSGKWDILVLGLTYLLQKVPDLTTNRVGLARIAGQLAFAYAALGRRQECCRWAITSLRSNPAQLRAPAALLVAAGMANAETLLSLNARRGRGL